MALSSHQKRLVTSLVLIPVLAAAISLGGWYIFAGILAVSLLGLWEFYTLFWRGGEGIGKKSLGLVLGALFLFAAKKEDPHLIINVLLLSFWLGNAFFLFCYSRKPQGTFYTNAAVLVCGLLYLPFVLQFFLFFSPAEIWLILLATFGSDTGAYYAGSTIGGPKIWPQISPKKTWAGSIGGLALCVVVTVAFGLTFGRAEWWALAILGVILSIAGQFGDFFESALKRWLGVKDSGNILPGHGGILDRIDGVLLSVPVYAAARSLYAFF